MKSRMGPSPLILCPWCSAFQGGLVHRPGPHPLHWHFALSLVTACLPGRFGADIPVCYAIAHLRKDGNMDKAANNIKNEKVSTCACLMFGLWIKDLSIFNLNDGFCSKNDPYKWSPNTWAEDLDQDTQMWIVMIVYAVCFETVFLPTNTKVEQLISRSWSNSKSSTYDHIYTPIDCYRLIVLVTRYRIPPTTSPQAV